MTTQLFRSLSTFAFVSIAWACIASRAQAQYPPPASANNNQPMIIHIHHHYATTASTLLNQPPTMLQSLHAMSNQSVLGNFAQPWKQNWDHLGFTGYLGQHGTLQQVSGLVVDTVTPGSPAAKMGLVVGDFITTINGTAPNSYRQVAVLFEETRENPKHEIEMTVWNPHTRRTSTVKAILEGLIPKTKPNPQEYPPEE